MKQAFLLLVALALAAPAGAQDTPEKDFKKALRNHDEAGLEKACRGLVQLGQVDEAKTILNGLQQAGLPAGCYWILVRAAAAFQNTDPLVAVAKYAVDKKDKPVARDLSMALHNNFTPGCELAMCVLLDGGTEELRVSALDHLLDIGGKPAVAATIDVIRKEDSRLGPEVRKRCFRLLVALTGKDFGDSAANWTGWWDANKDKPWNDMRKPGTGSGETTTEPLGGARQTDYDRLKTAKVLVVRAGSACKCKKDHDYDPGIDRVLASMPFETHNITKDKFENDATVTDGWLKQYLAIIAICTNIREHCICPTCKPGTEAGRMFQ